MVPENNVEGLRVRHQHVAASESQALERMSTVVNAVWITSVA